MTTETDAAAPDYLSPHFTLAEMTRTDVRDLADANRAAALADPALLDAGRALCAFLLEPIRTHFGRPVMIHSGFRHDALNKRIGGSATSQHVKFEAADFHVHGVALEAVFDWVRGPSGLRYGQVGLEGYAAGSPSWIHLSLGAPWRDVVKCQQAFVYEGTKYVFLHRPA